jgi:hypothetical protein
MGDPARGHEFEGYERTVDSHVKNLRRKIEADPGHPVIVQTALGSGYRLGLARDDGGDRPGTLRCCAPSRERPGWRRCWPC